MWVEVRWRQVLFTRKGETVGFVVEGKGRESKTQGVRLVCLSMNRFQKYVVIENRDRCMHGAGREDRVVITRMVQ